MLTLHRRIQSSLFAAISSFDPLKVLHKLAALVSNQVGDMVQWLRASDDGERNRHGCSLKPIRGVLLCPWEGHFRLFPLLGGLS